MSKRILFGVGRPFAPIYCAIMHFRAYCYRRKIFQVYRPEVPVVSVGNLTLGGTGKTPLVQYVTGLLQERGLKPAIVSRGYGGRARGMVNEVSDGRELLMDAEHAGDEPRFLAETLPGVPVLTGVVRKLPAVRAIQDGADVLVLDDGFQHMAVGRDLDLVLFNADHLAGNSRVFPGGDLREPVSALKRCHAFVMTSTSSRNEQRARQFGRLLAERFPGRPIFMSRYLPESLVVRGDNGFFCPVVPDETIRWFGFCGIARPEAFRSTLEEFGVQLVGMRSFSDHYRYRESDLDSLVRQAEEAGATALITTEKDLVKLKDMKLGLLVYAVRMTVQLESGFDDFVLRKLGLAKSLTEGDQA